MTGLDRMTRAALAGSAMLLLTAMAPPQTPTPTPTYADGVIHCPDGSTHRWPEKGFSLTPPDDAVMNVNCNTLDVKLTPAAGGGARDVDVDKAAAEITQLTNHPPLRQTPELTEAQRQQIADDEALDGRFGTIARLRTEWRLGKTNMLAEQAGRAAFYLVLALAVLFLLFRKRGSQA